MSSTCERGRWSSASTARIYINDGLLTLIDQELTTQQKVAVNAGLALWEDFFAE